MQPLAWSPAHSTYSLRGGGAPQNARPSLASAWWRTFALRANSQGVGCVASLCENKDMLHNTKMSNDAPVPHTVRPSHLAS